MKLAIEAQRHSHLVSDARKTLRQYLDDFIENIDIYSSQGAYAHKLLAAVTASRNLETYYKVTDKELAKRYTEFREQYEKVPRQMSYDSKW